MTKLVFVVLILAVAFFGGIVGLVWATGGFMTRACDQIERRPVTVRQGQTTFLADVCVGAWQ